MIGFRPYLFLVLALALFAVVAFDVGKHAGPCSSADALIGAREYRAARSSYSSVLESDSHSGCAKAGLARATDGECVEDQRIAVSQPSEARQRLLALAESDPPPAGHSCVWGELARVARASDSGASPR